MYGLGRFRGLYGGFTAQEFKGGDGLGGVIHPSSTIMTDDETTNRRREAAEAADDLRDAMREILGAAGEDDEEIEAARHAAAALDAIEDAEEALRLWRDHEEEAVELLGEEPRDDDGEE